MNSQDNPGSKLLIRLNTIILGVFGFFFLSKLLTLFPKDISNGMNSWVYTDWLIDYSSGFVRRGLSGELIDKLSSYAHPRFIIGVLTWLIFSIVVLGYIRLLYRSIGTLSPLIFIALLFLPNLLPFYLYDHGAFGRKEIIGFLFLLYHLYSLEASRKTQEIPDLTVYIKRIMPITLVFLPLHIFIHESSFLLFVPIHVIISYTLMQLNPSLSLSRKLFNLILIYLPAVLALLIVFVFGRPSFEIAQEICRKWELVNALEAGSCSFSGKNTTWALPGTISSLPWSISQASSLSLSFTAKSVLAWIINFLILGFSTVYAGGMIVRFFNQEKSSSDSGIIPSGQLSKVISYKYFLLPLFLSAPLYILGWDVGRWFAVTCINYIMVSLSRELYVVEGRFNIRTELVSKLLRVLIMLVGGAMILVGFLSDWIGLGSGEFGLTQILAILFGISLLFAGLIGQRFKDYIKRNSDHKRSKLLNYVNLSFLLLIIFSIRLPHCCQHNGYKMLAEPFKSLVQSIIAFSSD